MTGYIYTFTIKPENSQLVAGNDLSVSMGLGECFTENVAIMPATQRIVEVFREAFPSAPYIIQDFRTNVVLATNVQNVTGEMNVIEVKELMSGNVTLIQEV